MLSEYDNSFKADSTHFLGEGTSSSARLSLDSGVGLPNESFFSDDQNATNRTFDDSGCFSPGLAFGESPPTKWARITTPPNRRNAPDSGLRLNMFSPPSKKDAGFISPKSMRTPTTRNRIMVSTPSPFRVTISKTPLKLSNNENVAGYHIGRKNDIKMVNSTPMVRCIGVTSASKRCLLANETMITEDIDKSPSRYMFEGFSELPTMSPGKFTVDMEDEANDIDRTSSFGNTFHYSQNFANSERDEDCFANLLQPRGIGIGMENKEYTTYVENSNKSYAFITKEPLKDKPNPIIDVKKKKCLMQMEKNDREEINENLNKADLKKSDIEKWKNEPFVTPTKDVKPYSGQWLVISTGRTLSQQNLYSDAVQFLNSSIIRRSDLKSRRIPTIAKMKLFKHRFSKTVWK